MYRYMQLKIFTLVSVGQFLVPKNKYHEDAIQYISIKSLSTAQGTTHSTTANYFEQYCTFPP